VPCGNKWIDTDLGVKKFLFGVETVLSRGLHSLRDKKLPFPTRTLDALTTEEESCEVLRMAWSGYDIDMITLDLNK